MRRGFERLLCVGALVLSGCVGTADRDTLSSGGSNGSMSDITGDGSDDVSNPADGSGSDGSSVDDGSGEGVSGDDTSAEGDDGVGGDDSSSDGSASDGDTNDGTDDGSDGVEPGPIGDPGVPAGEHCASVANWDPQWVQFEEEVLVLTNEARAAGHNCDTEGNFGPAGPLTMQENLRCSARLHSQYMAETEDFDHTESANGSDPFDRMKDAGYSFRAAGENIAAGQSTPQEVVQGWLDSDGHCSNIMNPSFTEIGIGMAMGKLSGGWGGGSFEAPYWTQNFGTPF